MFKRILLVEDDAETAKCFSRLLAMSGYDVRVADGFGSAIALANEDRFDLLVCDIGLPDGSGLDLMRTLSSQYHTYSFTSKLTGLPLESAGFLVVPAVFKTVVAPHRSR